MPISSPILMFSLQAATATGMGPVQRPPAWLTRVNAFIAEQMREQKLPGIALAIIKDGVVLAAKGYGEANVEHHVPVTVETIFQSGSMGKQFTAAAVMLMVEEGRLALDDSNLADTDRLKLVDGVATIIDSALAAPAEAATESQ